MIASLARSGLALAPDDRSYPPRIAHAGPFRNDFGLASGALFAFHTLREAMANEVKSYKLGGVGKTAKIAGAHFGGYAKPANRKQARQ